ncbi:MAG: Uma2 family endonuclease, partial [Blastocatellia bacterium]
VYGQHGVQEYVVWRTEDREIDWFRLEAGQYVKVAPDEAGVIESRVFPGLRLATTALLAGDLARVLAELQKGLDSDEHKAFVQKLAALSQAEK